MIFNIAMFEIRRLFSGPLAWIILTLIQFLMALMFYRMLNAYLSQPEFFEDRGLTETVVAGYYQISGIAFLLLAPFVTMRLISEELRNGTIQLLFSSPVTLTELVLGKYLAIVLFLFFLLALSSLIPASLYAGTNLDGGHLAANIIGLAMLMAALTAIGLFISCLFRYPTVAAIFTFAVLILLWTAHAAGDSGNQVFNDVLNYMSLYLHYMSFTRGIFSTRDFLYFLNICLIFNLLSIWRLNSMRTHHW